MPSDRYLTAADLEEMTGIPANTFLYYATQAPDKGPPSFRLGKRRLWRRDVVELWLAEKEGKAAGPVARLSEEDREWLRRQVDRAGPLTEAQRVQLAELLKPARPG
jgi:prophage regulatory protein